VRDHPVIDLQGKQRDRNGQQVRHQRACRHFGHLAAVAGEFAPEPVRRGRRVGVTRLDIGKRQAGAQRATRIDTGEFGQRHLGAGIGAGGIIDRDGMAILRQHQHNLPRGHLRDGGPQVSAGCAGLHHLRGNPQRLHRLRQMRQVGVGPARHQIQPLKDVRGRDLAPKHRCVDRPQIRAHLRSAAFLGRGCDRRGYCLQCRATRTQGRTRAHGADGQLRRRRRGGAI
jgi:hypothetical protein